MGSSPFIGTKNKVITMEGDIDIDIKIYGCSSVVRADVLYALSVEGSIPSIRTN